LDTNVCIWLIRQRPVRVVDRLREASPEGVAISAITLAELEFGAARSSEPQRAWAALERFAAPFEVLPFGASATRAYGRLRAYLQQRGTPIGPMDLLIAAHAVSLGLTLVTNNLREFSRVPGLHAEDWTEAQA
jgi:tRNA(fMet)-specific endonuclease VapC